VRLSDRIAAHGLQANKGLGQHFLLDLNVTRKIARLSGAGPEDHIIEVGPGPGGLTQALLETGARVTAIERDARFLPLLAELAAAFPGRLEVLHADALKVEESSIAGPEGARIVSNLPYNVGTPLLVKWLTGAFRPRSMTLMFQKEVARRIVAEPGDPDYGRLAVLAAAITERRLVLEAPARAFGQRRKMLRAGLRALGGETLCHAAGVDPSVRPETLDLQGFLCLADALLTKA